MRISDWSSDVCSSDLFDDQHPLVFEQYFGPLITSQYFLRFKGTGALHLEKRQLIVRQIFIFVSEYSQHFDDLTNLPDYFFHFFTLIGLNNDGKAGNPLAFGLRNAQAFDIDPTPRKNTTDTVKQT